MWDKLSADEKKILSEAAAEAIQYERKVTREQEAQALDALKKAGMEVTELPAAEVAKLREKMGPIIDKYGAATAETLAALKAELAKQRK